MNNRIEKSYKDLNWDEVDFENGCWTWSCGGHPLLSNEWSINYIDDDGVETRYVMPKCINEMLILVESWGIDKTRRDFEQTLRKMLGCQCYNCTKEEKGEVENNAN